MRITALHNIREPGLIPNGFQREEAPAPAPDQAWQPEMRNRVEAMTDTRHAVEFLNPSVHLEVNGANRTSRADRPAVEMGRDRERVQVRKEEARKEAEFERRVAEYERILKFLRDKMAKARLEGAGEPVSQFHAGEGEAGEVQRTERARDVFLAMSREHKPAGVKREAAPQRQEEPQVDYYSRRGVEAYRSNLFI